MNSEAAVTGTIAIVGGGVMGRALCEGLIASRAARASDVIVAEPHDGRRASIAADLGARVTTDAASAVTGASVIVLAVKPQVFASAATSLSGRLHAAAPVISIMAGISTTSIADATGHAAIVRAIPNTAARLRRAMTVWYATPAVTTEQRRIAVAVLSAIGETLEVNEEGLIDPATAVSGSGPAYICLVAEAMIEGAVAVGFGREAAQRLVTATLSGTAALLAQPGAHPGLVREGVTSPAGTTAAGLQALESGAVRAAFVAAIMAAYLRAKELGSSR